MTPEREALATPRAYLLSHRSSVPSDRVIGHFPLKKKKLVIAMSGLEIVGVVIGAIPLVVAAIEKYRGRQSLISRRNKGPILRRLLQSLESQHFLLVTDIRLTLSKAGVPYDPASTQLSPVVFKDPIVSDAVDDYLGDNCDMYYNAVDRCHRALAELVQGISGLSPTPVFGIHV
jgi:hypothetical protein